MRMRKIFSTIELADGTIVGPVRVTLAHKVQAEKTAKARAIPLESVTFDALLSWLASRDLDTPVKGTTFDEWQAAIVDAVTSVEDPEDGDELDPTRTDRGADS